jgi:hypothetical protein
LIFQTVVAYKGIRSAAKTARTSAVITLTIGAVSGLCVLFGPSWQGAFVTAGLCGIGAMEYWGHRRIGRADADAAAVLGWNQVTFLAMIVLYCVAQMALFTPESIKVAAISPEARSQLHSLPGMEKSIDKQIERFAPLVMYGFYGLVIVLSTLSQGGLALYYFTRRKRIERFHGSTPGWARRVVLGVWNI